MAKVKKVKKPRRAEKIRAFLEKARAPKTFGEIAAAIKATADETKYVASTLLRLCDAGALKRREAKDETGRKVWFYRAAG